MIAYCDLTEISTKGSSFTWSNGRGARYTECKLDRTLCNNHWLDRWAESGSYTLPRHHSDHNPVVLSCKDYITTGPLPFRFKRMWTLHENFLAFVDSIWNSESSSGSAMSVLTFKLKKLKRALKQWNVEIFGDVNARVEKAKEDLSNIQMDISSNGFSPEKLEAEISAHSHLDEALNFQTAFLKEKSRLNWVSDGDRNSAFFHKMVKLRRATKGIPMMNIDGTQVTNQDVIRDHILKYYSELFSKREEVQKDNFNLIREVIPNMVSVHDNQRLTSIPTEEEIRSAVFAMDSNSAPGPDGFNGAFFQCCWNIIKKEVALAVKEFFVLRHVKRNLNSNFLVLIPKTENAAVIEKFRPIILGNFIFKICTKILADRLGFLAPTIISKNQFGFVKGRRIQDCIALASEGFNILKNKSKEGNIAIKVDIRKAFDTLDWDFVLEVLRCFGFSDDFRGLIKNIFESARISILHNGTPNGFFSCSRGVRQGDPLSPLLFDIAEDFLSRFITANVECGAIQGMQWKRGCLFPSHLLFADDVLLFCRGSKKNMETLNHIFKVYGELSGQCISYEKSKIFFGNSFSQPCINSLLNVFPLSRGFLPVCYLGVPLFQGSPKRRFLQSIADKIRDRFSQWKGNSLSIAGRLTLINSVIASSFIHSFSIYKWPASLLKELDSAIRNYLWSGNISERKLVTVAWSKTCMKIVDVVWAFAISHNQTWLCLSLFHGP